MSKTSHNKIDDGNFGQDEFPLDRPKVRIMNDNQWLAVRKRFRMSPRELEVAKLVCSGLDNKEISTLLGIRIATVKTHLRNVYRRVRVQRKLDMLLKFLDHGNTQAQVNLPIDT